MTTTRTEQVRVGFDTSAEVLFGASNAASAGTYANIVIAADDGTLTAALVASSNAGLSTGAQTNLPRATWYFGVKAYTSCGDGRALANIASKTFGQISGARNYVESRTTLSPLAHV